MMEYNALIASAPTQEIQEAFVKHYSKIHSGEYSRILVSISGGADSDVLLDMIEKIGYTPGSLKYVFFNTGIEFEATKAHIRFLEWKYGVKIHEIYAKMPVSIACKRYGVPFLSKQFSEYISRLQAHDFKWEDEPLDVLLARYPRCKVALRWWCNDWGEKSRFNISYIKWLKEFMIANPPTFKISAACCVKAKKNTAKDAAREFSPDLSITGVRRAEGGARAAAYKSCFSDAPFGGGCASLRPMFWFKKEDKEQYCFNYGVTHSECYSIYGLARTGCACCPYSQSLDHELEAARLYEPNLYKVAMSVFGASYAYTKAFHAFREKMEALNENR